MEKYRSTVLKELIDFAGGPAQEVVEPLVQAVDRLSIERFFVFSYLFNCSSYKEIQALYHRERHVSISLPSLRQIAARARSDCLDNFAELIGKSRPPKADR